MTAGPGGPGPGSGHPVSPRVVRVAVGRPREVPGPRPGTTTSTASWKSPVDGPVRLVGDNLDGDAQADRRAHGGPHKAVYAYGVSDLDWWAAELARDPERPELDPQVFGQNLTVEGADLREAVVGERWRIGDAVLEVAQPRIPCFKLGLRAGDPTMPRRFLEAERPGVYLRIVTAGSLAAGDAVEVTDRPAHGVRVVDAFTIFRRAHGDAARLLDAPQLPPRWLEWAREHSTS